MVIEIQDCLAPWNLLLWDIINGSLICIVTIPPRQTFHCLQMGWSQHCKIDWNWHQNLKSWNHLFSGTDLPSSLSLQEMKFSKIFSQNISASPLENANIRICIRIHSRLYILHVRRYPNQPTPFSCFCIWKILVCVTKTLQELWMLSSVKINCQVTKIQVLDCQFLRCFLVMSNNLSDQMYQRL